MQGRSGVTLRLVVVGILGGCADPSTAPAPEPPAAPVVVPAPAPAPARVTATQSIRWSQIEGSDNCFFFSGPDGTDDKLLGTATIVRDGTHVTMQIGNALFEGTYREGQLDLMRISTHTFGGPWLALERMHGTYARGTMVARYRYNECELADECPGRCTLTGIIAFTP
jgi:hypothetical protein